jgi:predicted NAD/FAD-binding protein
MSFSVQAPGALAGPHAGVERLQPGTVFAQRSNLVNPRFLGMLRDLLRFNRCAPASRRPASGAALMQPLGDFLREHRFGDAFRDWYFLPMLGCIWSCPTDQMLKFPVATMIRFCHNHGLIQVSNRPQWWTVAGGARHYVDKILAGIADKRLNTPCAASSATPRRRAVSAPRPAPSISTRWCWPRTPTRRWPAGQPTTAERRCWAPSATSPTAPCCTPTPRCCPSAAPPGPPGTTRAPGPAGARIGPVCLHYLINQLQPLPWQQPVVVSLNPVRPIRDPAACWASYDYAHPVFDLAAIRAGQVPAAAGAAAHLVLRRLDGLRLP